MTAEPLPTFEMLGSIICRGNTQQLPYFGVFPLQNDTSSSIFCKALFRLRCSELPTYVLQKVRKFVLVTRTL